MRIEKYYTDENGKVVIDGITFKVRKSVKYCNYLKAKNNIKRVKNVLAFGIFILILGFYTLLGSVGRVELLSLREIYDTWNLSTYVIIDTFGTIFLLSGLIIMKWGWSKETIYERWIDEYLGQNTTE